MKDLAEASELLIYEMWPHA